MYEYPISVHQEAGSFWSSCSDVPEAHSAGDSLEELLVKAVEGIALALTIYVDQSRPIPAASKPTEGQYIISLPAQAVAKIALWNAMQAQGVRVADLARMLSVSHPVATRLVDFDHNSKIEQVENALKHLGFISAFPYEQNKYFYAPFKEARDFDKHRHWTHELPGVSTEEAQEFVINALLPKESSHALYEAIKLVVQQKFRYYVYPMLTMPGKAAGPGIVFNYSAMPTGLQIDDRWIELTSSELYRGAPEAYRGLLGLEKHAAAE